MDRERFFSHMGQRYFSKREMIARIPLGAEADALWEELLNLRRSGSIVLSLHDRFGKPYWYVTTEKMVAASEKIVVTLLENEKEYDPYTEIPAVATLEEIFYTSYVDGSQMTMQEAMTFLQSDSPPQDVEELLIVNNRQAASWAGANLYRRIDEDFLKELAYYLTEGIDGGGQELRSTEWADFNSVDGVEFKFPPPSMIPDCITELSLFLADTRTHPLIKAAVAQAWTMVVRPFSEGNERLGRILSSVILLRAGYIFFGDVSLSALIARKGYGYYKAITDILTDDHGGDLTYFVEYFLELLSRAIDERSLRQSRKDEQDRAAEKELARTPLTPPAPQLSQAPEMKQEESSPADKGDNRSDEAEMPSAEWQDLFSAEMPVLPQNLQKVDNVKKLRQLAVDREKPLGRCAYVILQWLANGTDTFTCSDVQTALHKTYSVSAKLIRQLKTMAIIEPYSWKSRERVYRVAKTEKSTPVRYIEVNTAGEFLGTMIPVFDGEAEQRPVEDYSPEIMDRIAALGQSIKSPKDKRLFAMLNSCLGKGTITRQDYRAIGEESKMYTDMMLAQQMGIVEKETTDCYKILTEPTGDAPNLSKTQKKIITEIYESFGEDFFSTGMVVATLDYTESHVSAFLHQFTLMKILNCQEGPVFQYQFLINPQDNPECFEVA